MNAVAMKVVSAEKHPNADALFLYKLKSADKEVEIIANLDRNYQVGDIVAIARRQFLKLPPKDYAQF